MQLKDMQQAEIKFIYLFLKTIHRKSAFILFPFLRL